MDRKNICERFLFVFHMPIFSAMSCFNRKSYEYLRSNILISCSFCAPPTIFFLTHFFLNFSKLTPLTSNSDVVSHFMGVQIELPLSRAEVAALLSHSNSTPSTYLSTSSSSSSSNSSSSSGKAGDAVESLDNEERAKGRIHGEILYQYQQKQYQLHQERISELQMQQAYCSLSTTTQDAYSSQVGGSYEDRGCSAAHSLCVPDEPSYVPLGSGSILMDRERCREVPSPATLQQQQMQLLEMQLAQKQQKQLEQQQQQYVKDEYATGQRAVRAPSSSTSSSFSQFITSQNGSQPQWAAQRHLLSSTVSADSVNDRDHRSDSSSGAVIARYETHPQQDMVNLRSVSQDGNGSSNSRIQIRTDVEKGSGSGSNNNSSNDDEKGPTWYKNASNTSSV